MIAMVKRLRTAEQLSEVIVSSWAARLSRFRRITGTDGNRWALPLPRLDRNDELTKSQIDGDSSFLFGNEVSPEIGEGLSLTDAGTVRARGRAALGFYARLSFRAKNASA
jgi:hypothetical protein